MLVLTRKQNESIIINGDIVITITEIRNGKVRVGIKAPPSVSVFRRELFDAANKTNLPRHKPLRHAHVWKEIPIR